MKAQLYSVVSGEDCIVTAWLAILDIVARDLSRVQYGIVILFQP